ncbi:MAG: hypothetical protein ACLUI3_14385 [Christensenellales bacterium]
MLRFAGDAEPAGVGHHPLNTAVRQRRGRPAVRCRTWLTYGNA